MNVIMPNNLVNPNKIVFLQKTILLCGFGIAFQGLF